MTEKTLRQSFPLSWTFHANTMRWAHNAEPPPEDVAPSSPREDSQLKTVPLPGPINLSQTLEEAIEDRCSCRVFDNEPLDFAKLGTILKRAYGVTGIETFGRMDFPSRPVPSGGGLYPLEINLVCQNVAGLPPGIYHYLPELNVLECVQEAVLPAVLLTYLFMGQHKLVSAPVLIVVSAVLERSMKKYGDRGYRYVLFEAGHVVQNMNLVSTALGLGACNMGGFFDDELAKLIGLNTEIEVALYATAIGNRSTNDRWEMRDI